jgi:ceramide glucosyltransferase
MPARRARDRWAFAKGRFDLFPDEHLGQMIIQWFSGLCVAAACIGCGYLLAAAISTLTCGRRRAPGWDRPPPVTILKPLHREDSRIFACLSSFCTQRYDAAVQLVFGVEAETDPAIAMVERLRAEFPHQEIDLQIDGRIHGTNRKVSNLANMMRLARHPILMISDCDILVAPDHLARTVAALQQPGVGAVTCLYHGVPVRGIWSRISALGINAHFLPNAIFGVSCGLAEPCFGSTIVLKRDTLTRIGGLESFADCTADDYSLGEAVRKTAQRVEIPSFSVGHACRESSAAELLVHELRWARTLRSLDPLGYLGTMLAHPLPLALLAAATETPAGLGIAAVAVLSRCAVCACVERRFGLERQPYWLLPLRDLLSFAVFVASLFGRTVTWRGRALPTPEGNLLPNRRMFR